jgi:protein-tyrosine phosphatase
MPTGVLFVCLGNICRSPIAEGIFIHLARERNASHLFRVESAGTGGWHVGELPDRRAIAVAAKHGLRLTSRAQQVDPAAHFKAFDWLIPMDRANRDDLFQLGAPPERVRLLRSFDPALAAAAEHHLDVPDPYYGGDSGFDEVYAMSRAACGGLLDFLFTRIER